MLNFYHTGSDDARQEVMTLGSTIIILLFPVMSTLGGRAYLITTLSDDDDDGGGGDGYSTEVHNSRRQRKMGSCYSGDHPELITLCR